MSEFKQSKEAKSAKSKAYIESDYIETAADPVLNYMSKEQVKKAIENARKMMEKEAKALNFIEAAMFRDEIFRLEKLIKEKKN